VKVHAPARAGTPATATPLHVTVPALVPTFDSRLTWNVTLAGGEGTLTLTGASPHVATGS